ncbi:hypothetical protein D3C78_1481080 [compost metagenome]
MIHQIVGHDIGRRQRFAGVHQQGFGTEFGVHDEHGAGCARGGHDVGARVEVVIERALGGFVELFGVGAFVRGGRVGFRRIWSYLEHKNLPLVVSPQPSRY